VSGKLQPACGKVCANGPRRVLAPFRSLRGPAPPVPAQRVSRPLPSGALPPGPRWAVDRGEGWLDDREGGSWQGRLSVSTQWRAELLSSRGRVTAGDDLADTTGSQTSDDLERAHVPQSARNGSWPPQSLGYLLWITPDCAQALHRELST